MSYTVRKKNRSETKATSNDNGEFKEKLLAFYQRSVEAAEPFNGDPQPGVVSAVYILGEQKVPDGSVPTTDSPEKQQEEMENNPGVYYKEVKEKGVLVLKKFWPKNPLWCYSVSVDFPHIPVEGMDGVERPLRINLNGSYTPKGKTYKSELLSFMYAAEMRKLKDGKVTTDGSGDWSVNPSVRLYKLAEAVGLVKQGQPFDDTDLPQALGKYLMLKFNIEMREGKYYDVGYVKIEGSVPSMMKGMLPPVDHKYSTLVDITAGAVGVSEGEDGVVELNLLESGSEEEKTAIEHIPAVVLRQMTKSNDYKTSPLRSRIKDIKPWAEGSHLFFHPEEESEGSVDTSVQEDNAPPPTESSTMGGTGGVVSPNLDDDLLDGIDYDNDEPY